MSIILFVCFDVEDVKKMLYLLLEIPHILAKIPHKSYSTGYGYADFYFMRN